MLTKGLTLEQKRDNLCTDIRLKARLFQAYFEIEQQAKEQGRDTQTFPRCAFCKYKIIPGVPGDERYTLYWKKKNYHQVCAENFLGSDIWPIK